jgi:hypothetical protein
MKHTIKLLTVLALAALIGFAVIACDDGNGNGGDPCAGGHDFQTYTPDNNGTCMANGTETAICERSGCSETHTQDIEDSKNLNNHAADCVYMITLDDTTFSVDWSLCLQDIATNESLDEIIEEIKDDADGKDITIQFGDGETELDIGTAFVKFDNEEDDWGLITLTGKITSAAPSIDNTQGTIILTNGALIDSKADIKNTVTSGRAILNNNAEGTIITISGGTLLTPTGATSHNIHNRTSGTINITNGTFESFGTVVYNHSAGKVNISSGTFTNTNNTSNSIVIENNSSGTITIESGTFNAFGRAVHNVSGTVTIKGGIFSSSNDNGNTIYNQFTTGTINIKDGTFTATSGRVVYNNNIGTITIEGGTFTATEENGYGVYNSVANGKIEITGGTITTVTTDRALSWNAAAGVSGYFRVTTPPTVINSKTGEAAKTEASGTGAGDIEWL